MAFAIASGLVKKGLKGNKIIVSCRDKSSFHSGWKNLKVQETVQNIDCLNKSLITILCCKPNNLDEVANDLNHKISFCKINFARKTVISILAGISLPKLKEKLYLVTGNNIEVLRAMPNTPIQIGCGATAITPCEEKNKKIIETIFKSLGIVEFIDDCKFDAITGLRQVKSYGPTIIFKKYRFSGSGSAYIYTIIDALTDAGVKEGLPCELSRRFAAQTVLGSAKTVIDTKKHPAQLKNEVCSPGGTTIHAIYALEKGGLRACLMDAVHAASERSKEMNK